MKIFMHRLADNPESESPTWMPTSHYRAWLPSKFCVEKGIDITCSEKFKGRDWDVFWLTRLPHSYIIPILEKLKKKKCKIVWGLDDNLFNVPKSNHASKLVNTKEVQDLAKWMRDFADKIVVSTKPLANAIGCKEKTVVLPNLIDLDEWPQPYVLDNPTILWAGSSHHQKDLELLLPAVKKLSKEKFQIVFFGHWPKQLGAWQSTGPNSGWAVSRYPGVHYIPHVSVEDYPAKLSAFAGGVGIAPLGNNSFNEAKSNCKYMEFSLAGLVTIASDIEPYKDCKYKISKPGDWYEVIRSLAGNRDKRIEEITRARKEVVKKYSWQHSPAAEKWREFFRSLA
jgi:glycosyltransferase involved in cell wall biosynthesis